MKTSVAAVGPNMNGSVPWMRFSSSQRSTSVGSSTWAAPTVFASSRRAGLRSTATTSSTPRSARVASAMRPMGPHPNTTTFSPGRASDWFTACMPTARGSASAAVVRGMPSGTAEQAAAVGRLGHVQQRRQAALGTAGAHRPVAGVGRAHDHPVADRHAGDLARRASRRRRPSRDRAGSGARASCPCGRRRRRCRRCRRRRCARARRGDRAPARGCRRGASRSCRAT